MPHDHNNENNEAERVAAAEAAELAQNSAEDDAIAVAAGNARDAGDQFVYQAKMNSLGGGRKTSAGSQAAMANAAATVESRISAEAAEQQKATSGHGLSDETQALLDKSEDRSSGRTR